MIRVISLKYRSRGADDQAVGHGFRHDDHLPLDLLDRRDQLRGALDELQAAA